MAAAMIMRPSWPSIPPEGHYADQPDQVLPDQGPAQAVIGEMAALLRNTRGSTLLGGIVPSAIRVSRALEAAFSGWVLRPDPENVKRQRMVQC